MTQHILNHNELHQIWISLKNNPDGMKGAIMFRELMASKGIDVTRYV